MENTSTSEGLAFVRDVQFCVMHGLYGNGIAFDKAQKIAEAAIKSVCAVRWREMVYIPMVNVRAIRDQVLNLDAAGVKPFKIARLVGKSERQIYNYLKTRGKSVEQLSRHYNLTSKNLLEVKMLIGKELLKNQVNPAICKSVCEELIVFLQKHWGGLGILIPCRLDGKRNRLLLDADRQTLYNDHKQGIPIKELAEKYHLEKKQIKELLRRMEKQGMEAGRLPSKG